ncbi:uncharacterized protein LOC111337269 isoform X2 [Stylophora pistillata]|uniref:TNFR-Cys domain-containing protein n=1 Tax=Stylophora pistillata TaxID=50429 RepID=A0A2B4RTI6_STYPI|nr:uncharacterized protein LOC111337269 isoform X2 [Stylophora pistillata]PFX20129.1 hypothetical protein AWC38_SpisGene15428 [Stylophora pistillata]
MLGIACFALLSSLASASSTALNCQPGYYFDGKGCTKCTQCPLGYGLKNHCSDTGHGDTQCQPCIEGYDYSDTIGLDECIQCDTYSNCLPGQSKMIKKCTVSSPPECDGCEDGYYIDDEVNGCTRCSSPCRNDEEEVQKCLTKHDRICKPRSTRTDPVSTASSTPTTSTSSTSVHNSKDKALSTSASQRTAVTKTDAGRHQSSGEVPTAEGSSQAQGTLSKYLMIRISVGVCVTILLAIVITVVGYKVTRARRRKSNDNGDPDRTNTLELAETQPCVPKGLDRFVKHLEIHEKRIIIREISGSLGGFTKWQTVLDKLEDPELVEESRVWTADDDEKNIKKFLDAYGEKEGSTAKRLIQAIRDAGLSLSANELERKLDSDRGGQSGNSVEIPAVENDTWV